jgi:uncharacterized protein (TIGR02246 family)
MTASSARDAVSLANQRFMAAFARGDSIAVSDSYTSEAQVLPPQSEPIAGREAIAGFWKAVMGMGVTGVTLQTVEFSDFRESAHEVGRYALTAANGQTVDHGKYVVLWQLENGDWKLHRDIWNTSVAAAP